MTREEAEKKYNELFSTIEEKAEAFDKIAENYYFSNFGSFSKVDMDVLMFSLYIERILSGNDRNFEKYSDYTLSKQLGITQSRVSALKEKKELRYPYEAFDWKASFLAIADKALYEDERIKIHIPDKNLYIEIKHAIETLGGFVEVQLTRDLLQVRLPYFIDLMLCVEEDATRDELCKEIRSKIKENHKDIDFIEKESIGKVLIDMAPELIIDIIGDCIPVFGKAVKPIASNVYKTIKKTEFAKKK